MELDLIQAIMQHEAKKGFGCYLYRGWIVNLKQAQMIDLSLSDAGLNDTSDTTKLPLEADYNLRDGLERNLSP